MIIEVNRPTNRFASTLALDPRFPALSVARVSAGAVSTLGLTMTLGRGFVADEDVHVGPKAVVIAHPLWRDRYGSAPDILGRTVRLDGEERTVVGVERAGQSQKIKCRKVERS